jgi:transposase-like protein
VPSTKVREIAAMLKAIHAGEDIAAAREKAIRVIEKLRGLRLSRAAELVEVAIEETLTYAFPEEHWRRIRTNNPLERILREIRRRTVSWARFLTVNRRSTSPPLGCATSPARHGLRRDISTSSCSRTSR